jgi:hypothetical protein
MGLFGGHLPGVVAAARSVNEDKPVLAIRGISDVVGYIRDRTNYPALDFVLIEIVTFAGKPTGQFTEMSVPTR